MRSTWTRASERVYITESGPGQWVVVDELGRLALRSDRVVRDGTWGYSECVPWFSDEDQAAEALLEEGYVYDEPPVEGGNCERCGSYVTHEQGDSCAGSWLCFGCGDER